MSRAGIKIDQVKVRLGELQNLYIRAKEKEKVVKKEVSDYNEEIKNLMIDNKLDSIGRLQLTHTQKETFNELQGIEILRENLSAEDFAKVVKTKEYIDDDALEKLAYNSAFDMSILAPCKQVGRPVYTLRIAKDDK